MGYHNPSIRYTINNAIIKDVEMVTDLGVTFTSDLKPSAHCLKAVSKAQKMICLIRLCFKFLDARTLTVLYKALVRPILEYCSQVWCPYLVKDIETLEKVQRRFTRFLPCLRDLSYEDRLSHLDIESLYARRLRFDLQAVYKILHGAIDVDPSLFFNLCDDSRTRGHNYKLSMSYSRLDSRRHFFSSRVVPLWNSLPDRCVNAPNFAIFKSELSKYLISAGVH